MITRRVFGIVCLVASVTLPAAGARAEDTPKKPARILMLTQSAGFRHGSVTRKNMQLSPAERGEYLSFLGLEATARDRLIRACYERLKLGRFRTGDNPGPSRRTKVLLLCKQPVAAVP